jgi:2-acylglycerol O-acyltransferase 2
MNKDDILSFVYQAVLFAFLSNTFLSWILLYSVYTGYYTILVIIGIITFLTGSTTLDSEICKKTMMTISRESMTTWYGGCTLVGKVDVEGDGIMRCFHPHGPYVSSFPLAFNGEDGFIPCVHEYMKYVPFTSILLWASGYQSTSKESFHNLMSQRKRIIFYPSGNRETAIYQYKRHNIEIGNKGFIKFALKYGYRVQPVYSYNETSLHHYHQLELSQHSIAYKDSPIQFLSSFNIPLSWGSFWMIPKRIPALVAYGDVVQFPQIDNPTDYDIDKWHKIYIKMIKKTFYTYLPEWKKIDPETEEVLHLDKIDGPYK